MKQKPRKQDRSYAVEEPEQEDQHELHIKHMEDGIAGKFRQDIEFQRMDYLNFTNIRDKSTHLDVSKQNIIKLKGKYETRIQHQLEEPIKIA